MYLVVSGNECLPDCHWWTESGGGAYFQWFKIELDQLARKPDETWCKLRLSMLEFTMYTQLICFYSPIYWYNTPLNSSQYFLDHHLIQFSCHFHEFLVSGSIYIVCVVHSIDTRQEFGYNVPVNIIIQISKNW